MHTDTNQKAPVTNPGKDSAGNYVLEHQPEKKDIRPTEESKDSAPKPTDKPAEMQTGKPSDMMETPQRSKETDKGEVQKELPRN